MATAEDRPRGGLAADLSRQIVQLLHEYTGRGPTKARTYIHDDLIVCLLRDTLTKGERKLVAAGETEVVLAARRASQRAMGAECVTAVEELTGRKVIAFVSENHIEPDLALESFVLEPLASAAAPTGRASSP